MRPTKSIKYCYDCGFRKIHFASEEKAKNFVRFNAEEIRKEKGYAPLRAYYCIVCGCWHLTSKPEFPYKSRTQKVLEAFKARKKNKCVYTARKWGLTVIDDKELNRIAESNLRRMVRHKRPHRQKENKPDVEARRKEMLKLADEITLNLQDAYSYMQSDLYAAAKMKVVDAECIMCKLAEMQMTGFDYAMEQWRGFITSYKAKIEDRCLLG